MPTVERIHQIYSSLENSGQHGRLLDRGRKEPDKKSRPFKEVLREKMGK